MPCTIKVYMKNEQKAKVIVGVPKVPKQYSKQLRSAKTGKLIYYVDRTYGLANGLDSKMKLSDWYPGDDTYCEITIPIERID